MHKLQFYTLLLELEQFINS